MPSVDFNAQPTLVGDSLLLRPLIENDFEGLYEAANDPEIWAGHPVKDRYKREVFESYFRFLIDGGTALVIRDRSADRIIGCSRYYAAPDRPDDIAVGFTFLHRAYWGGATNRELKRLMVEHAFAHVSAVWFHIDPTNIRSQKATAKLGAQHIYDADLDLSGKIVRWMCFRLDRQIWKIKSRLLPRRSPF